MLRKSKWFISFGGFGKESETITTFSSVAEKEIESASDDMEEDDAFVEKEPGIYGSFKTWFSRDQNNDVRTENNNSSEPDHVVPTENNEISEQDHNVPKNQELTLESPTVARKLTSSFQEKYKRWQVELKESVDSIDKVLTTKVNESTDDWNKFWERMLSKEEKENLEIKSTAISQEMEIADAECDVYIEDGEEQEEIEEERSIPMECEASAHENFTTATNEADVNKLLCGSLIDEANEFWKQLVTESIPGKIDEIWTTSSKLFRECVDAGKLGTEASALDKVHSKSLMQAYDAFNDRAMSVFSTFSELLNKDISSIVKDACSDAYDDVVAAGKTDDKMAFLSPATEKIKVRLSALLSNSVEKLQKTEKELDSAIHRMLSVLKARASQPSAPPEDLGTASPSTTTPITPAVTSATTVSAAPSALPSTTLSTTTLEDSSSISDAYREFTKHMFSTSPPALRQRHTHRKHLKRTRTMFSAENEFGSSTNDNSTPFITAGSEQMSHRDSNIFRHSAWSPLSQFAQNLALPDALRLGYKCMQQTLSDAKLAAVEVRQDSNSQFRALAHQFYRDENAHGLVRSLLLDEISGQVCRYSHLISPSANFDRAAPAAEAYVRVEEYSQRMSLASSNGDFVTLQAFCNLYGCSLAVFSPLFHEGLKVVRPDRGSRGGNIFSIAYLTGNHYQSLIIPQNVTAAAEGSTQAEALRSALCEAVAMMPTAHFSTSPSTSSPRHKRMRMAKPSKGLFMQDVDQTQLAYSLEKLQLTINDNASEHPKKRTKLSHADIIPAVTGTLGDLSPISSASSLSDRLEQDIAAPTPEPFLLRDETSLLLTTPSSARVLGGFDETGNAWANTPVVKKRVSSLVDICTTCVADNFDTVMLLRRGTVADPRIPQELSHKLISAMKANGTLNDTNLIQLLSVSLNTLDLSRTKGITSLVFPHIISTCPNLKSVTLSDCSNIAANGSVFARHALLYPLRKSTSIQHLDLSRCYTLTHDIVANIARACPQLRSLVLSGTKISDLTLNEISVNCKYLNTLIINGCANVTDEGMKNLPTSLLCLDVSNCKITDKGLALIAARQASLTAFKIAGGKITDQGLQSCSFPHLVSLDLSNSPHITGTSFPWISALSPKLEHLNASCCRALVASAFSSARFGNLQTLDLTRCLCVSDDTLLDISKLGNGGLKKICLGDCEDVSDVGLVQLLSLHHDLEKVDLSKCMHLTDEAVNALAFHAQASLTRLSLSGCTKITDKALRILGQSCLGLVWLDISGCESVTDSGLAAIASGCPALENLSLAECTRISDPGIADLARKCPHLQSLSVAFCTVSNMALCSLSALPEMQVLDVSHCPLITMDGVQQAMHRWPKLDTLVMRGHSKCTSEGLRHPSLRYLTLSWCRNLEDIAVSKIGRGCPSLETLDLSRCPKLSGAYFSTLAQTVPNLRLLNLKGSNVPLSSVLSLYHSNCVVLLKE